MMLELDSMGIYPNGVSRSEGRVPDPHLPGKNIATCAMVQFFFLIFGSYVGRVLGEMGKTGRRTLDLWGMKAEANR